MAANTSPIFTNIPVVTWADLGSTVFVSSVNTGTGSTAYDGTTNAFLVFTSNPTDGSFLNKIVCEAGGTNTVSVLRIHINNGSTNATPDNNTLYMQYSLPATTASNTVATSHVEIPLNIQLPPSYRVFVSLGATSNLASGWAITAVGGNY